MLIDDPPEDEQENFLLVLPRIIYEHRLFFTPFGFYIVFTQKIFITSAPTLLHTDNTYIICTTLLAS